MPRLKVLDKNQGSPKAQQIMAELEGKKKLLNIFKGMANSAVVLDGYLKLSATLAEGKLEPKVRESIALAVGQTNRCPYCLAAHTAIGKAAGLDDTAVLDARWGRSPDKRTSAAVILANQLVTKHGQVSDGEVAAARNAGLDDGDIAEVVAAVVLNIYTNYFNLLNQTEVDLPKVPVELLSN